MTDYYEYLAINVLNEHQIVNYRVLSRALKVHVNAAKQMLFDFHARQNRKKSQAVHATYLLSGVQKVTENTNGHSVRDANGDVEMQSSPYPSSSHPVAEQDEGEAIMVKLVKLVVEEDLEEAKSLFSVLQTIHVYSVEPGPSLSDLQILTDCNRKMQREHVKEAPLITSKPYGVVQNSGVRRRTVKSAVVADASERPVTTTKEPVKATVKTAQEKSTLKREISDKTQKTDSAKVQIAPEKPLSRPSSRASNPVKTQTLKREESSLFKSFANGKTKQPKAAAAATEATKDTEQPSALSDEEADGNEMDLDNDNASEKVYAEPKGESRQERAAKLREMMDVEDEPMDDAQPPVTDDRINRAEEPGAAEDVDAGATEPSEAATATKNSRRRGRRRITKKRTVKDEEGYLVTKEETAWESFSEDEPLPIKTAEKSNKKTTAAGGEKKAGQGNIMSFFGKK